MPGARGVRPAARRGARGDPGDGLPLGRAGPPAAGRDRPRRRDGPGRGSPAHGPGRDSPGRTGRARHQGRRGAGRRRAPACKSQLALAASVLALVVVGGGGASWYVQQRQARMARVDSLLQSAGSSLDLAERSDGAAATAKEEEARLALGQAIEASKGGLDGATAARLAALQERSAQSAKLRTLVAALEDVRGGRAEHGRRPPRRSRVRRRVPRLRPRRRRPASPRRSRRP